MADFATDQFGPDVKWHLAVRIEQPIAGCELAPHPFLKLKSRMHDNATKARMQDTCPHNYVYRWFRGPKKDPCANTSCHRNSNFSPAVWATDHTSGDTVLCAVCERGGVPRYESTFCSLRCFKDAWKTHSKIHPTLSFATKTEASSGKKAKEDVLDFVEAVEEEDPSLLVCTDHHYAGSPGDWVEICNTAAYTPQPEDVGRVLKVLCSAVAQSNPAIVLAGPVTVYSSVVLSAPTVPPSRPMRVCNPGSWPSGVSTVGNFRVLSYNVLAEVYATRQMYPLCDSWSLSWSYRRKMLFEEIAKVDPDVLCLQEVQVDHFESDIKPFLDSIGYSGHHDQKTRESMGQAGKIDGCALFYRRSKMRLAETYVIKYNDCVRTAVAQQGRLDDQTTSKLIARLSKDNVAQVAVLEILAPSVDGSTERTFVCVVNTHLYSNHLYPDVKLWQTVALLGELENFVSRRDLPLVLCGDFNSEPQSAVYQFLAEGGVDMGHSDLENVSGKMIPGLESSRHSIELYSAMQVALGQEPPFTNYTSNFQGTLDYIWFSPSRLRMTSFVDLPDESELVGFQGALPNAVYPSDHFFLCSDFIVSSGATSSPVLHGSVASMMSSAGSRAGRRMYSNSPPLPGSAKKPHSSRNITR